MAEPLFFSPTTTLQTMVEAAEHYNAGQMQMVFRNHDDTPIAAVIVVRGEWTQEVLNAISALEGETEDETEVDPQSWLLTDEPREEDHVVCPTCLNAESYNVGCPTCGGSGYV